MKKLLLTTAAAAILTSASAYAATGDFYLKANAGWSKLNNLEEKVIFQQRLPVNLKNKSENTGFAGIGIGYNFLDNARVDLTYDHFFDHTLKQSADHPIPNPSDVRRADAHVKIHSKTKLKLDTVLLNFYVDLFDLSAAKIFAGAGAGVSFFSAKIKGKANIDVPLRPGAPHWVYNNDNLSAKAKNKTDLAYALHLGGSTEFTDCVHGELTYSFRDFGEVKVLAEKQRLRAHQVAAGIRVDL